MQLVKEAPRRMPIFHACHFSPPADRFSMKTDCRTFDFLGSARRTLALESAALAALEARLDTAFVQACLLMLDCQGRVVVTGMGKSGHVANKISSTLASTGTPAFFVHPAEASHGDLGMITRQDVVLALSNSGTTAEVLAIVPLIKRMQARLISMTGDAASPLARAAEVHLDVAVAQEACPLGLAPTASTTTALAMGDALAVALLEARGFTAEQFAFSHPGGSLGRRLLLKVEDLMHGDASVPKVTASTPLRDALAEISRCGFGLTSVVDGAGPNDWHLHRWRSASSARPRSRRARHLGGRSDDAEGRRGPAGATGRGCLAVHGGAADHGPDRRR
jgi:arabinose-5-phosphate isomerase